MPCAPYIPAALPPRVGFLATRATNQSIADVTAVDVTLPTEVFDSNSYFTPGGSTATIPSGKGGLYAITGQVAWAAVGLGTAPYLKITAGGIAYEFNGLTQDGFHAASIVVPLAVADTIKLTVRQSSGAPVNIVSARFSGFLIGL